ncbi:MAG: hypothetical protein K0R63_1749 [Rickettsiales bacterium]|nr:hypothetical protein [Rickettsiales bacterium]
MKEFVDAILKDDEAQAIRILRTATPETVQGIKAVALRKIIEKGQLQVLQFLYALSIPTPEKNIRDLQGKNYENMDYAAETSQHLILEFLVDILSLDEIRSLYKDIEKRMLRSPGNSEFNLMRALFKVRLEKEREEPFPIPPYSLLRSATHKIPLKVVKFLFDEFISTEQERLEAIREKGYEIIKDAILFGNFEILLFLLEMLPPVERELRAVNLNDCLLAAAKAGHCEVLHIIFGIFPPDQRAHYIDVIMDTKLSDTVVKFLVAESIALDKRLPAAINSCASDQLERIFGTADTLEIFKNMSVSKDEVLGDIERRIKYFPDIQFAKSYVGRKAEEAEKAAEKRVAIAQVFRGFTDQKDFPPDLAARFAIRRGRMQVGKSIFLD